MTDAGHMTYTETDHREIKILSETQSVCPECFQKISARRLAIKENVFLEKKCPDHGIFMTPIWKGLPSFESWVRPKIPTTPPVCHTQIDKGCPYDCGLCPDHHQRTCTALLEVTASCNMNCPVCFADSSLSEQSDPSLSESGLAEPGLAEPDLAEIEKWFRIVMETTKGCNIQISGGEPTMRDDLPEIVSMGKKTGFSFIQINTNGLRLGRDINYVQKLKNAGLSSVFLQFDATCDSVYQKIRGRSLVDIKDKAILNCIKHEIGVVLVPTIVAGINDFQIGDIIRKALSFAPGVRGVHFQPLSCFGRYPSTFELSGRMTLPEIMQSIENQTNQMVKTSHFKPPGCENALCSFNGSFFYQPGGTLKPAFGNNLSTQCCDSPEIAELGAIRAVSTVARNWCAPARTEIPLPKEIPTDQKKWPDFDSFINSCHNTSFSISGMAFQDAWTLDLERLRDCCIHVLSKQGKLIPFCAYNLTNVQGKSLYGR